jgi:hypothetical protein
MTTENIFSRSSLSEASYAILDDVVIGNQNQLRDALVNNGFSLSKAEAFIAQWKFIDHLPNTDTGFSATVFESLNNPGEMVFAQLLKISSLPTLATSSLMVSR